MKRSSVFVFFLCIMILCTACSGPAKASDAAAPGTAAEVAKPVDSGLTLEKLKKAAQDAGCEIEEVKDFQLIGGQVPVAGFNLIYKDELSESHIPVLEFSNSEEALAYAEQVNDAGYNMSIVNGKFMTITGSQYGIPTNGKEQAFLEKIMDSKVMEYTKKAPVVVSSANDYAGAYLQIDAINKAVDELVTKSILLYDKSAPEDKRIGDVFIAGSLISSMDLAFTSGLKEDQTQIDAVAQVWQMFGCTDVKISHDAPHNYTLTGKRAGLDTSFEIKCSFSPGTGSLRIIDKDGGEVVEFYEFVPLDTDKYAVQTLYARAIVEYKEGKIGSFVYTTNKTDKSLAYNYEADGIYEKGGALDEDWVTKAGKDSYERYIAYDGTKLKISADTFFGERLNTEIDAQ